PSHKSIFYSLYPSIHKTSFRGMPKEKLSSPIEVIRASGYRTAAFTGGGQMSRAFGFARGFETFWEPKTDPFVKHQTEEMQQAAFNWLEKHFNEKFFLFLHTYQTHCPYSPPQEFLQKWAGWYDGPFQEICYPDVRLERRRARPVDYEYVRSLYTAELNYVDFIMGQLFKKLKALGIYDRTLIVFLSDHGESLGERGYFGHSQLFQVQLHVPLILHISGVQAMQIDAPLESLDVMPTIFELLKLESKPNAFQGQSIVPLIKNPNVFNENRPLISEQKGQVRVRVNQFAMVFSTNGNFPDRLYNLETDPLELENIATKNPQIIEKMKLHYYQMMVRAKNLSAQFVLEEDKKHVMDENTKEQLSALGYVGE
ncbi:sulfatase-like hydrolase/transferase, partial [bacterium]|nr:sulfatase-like hydrolase/transferase [bacterium]